MTTTQLFTAMRIAIRDLDAAHDAANAVYDRLLKERGVTEDEEDRIAATYGYGSREFGAYEDKYAEALKAPEWIEAEKRRQEAISIALQAIRRYLANLESVTGETAPCADDSVLMQFGRRITGLG